MTATLLEVPWSDARAVALRDAMNVETGAMYAQFMADRTPEQQAATDAALTVDSATITYTVIALEGETPVAHAALRPVVTGSIAGALEVKKVFVAPSARGTGLSRRIMADLEAVARERGVTRLVLQTGPLQVAAIALYEHIGYEAIPVFGAYAAVPGALCFGKTLA